MKDPAFLFYPGDWMGGTQWFTFEQKGCYMELLVLQFNTWEFTESQAKQVLSICFDKYWDLLKQKFVCENGVYYNQRLRDEIVKRKKFSESRRINGLKPKTSKIKEEAYAQHMEDENENRNKDINKRGKGVQGGRIEAFDEAEFYPFEEFWNDYDKKVGDKSKLKKKYSAVSVPDRAKIKDYLPKYIASEPNKKFRKNPETFLNNKSWNDEIIQSENGKKTGDSKSVQNANDRRKSVSNLKELSARILQRDSSEAF